MPEPSPDVTEALIQAVWHADLTETRRLLAFRPDIINAHVYRQNTLLFFAARVPGYSGHGDAPGVEDANESGRVELVDLLVASGADVNAVNQRKVTPLHMAVRYCLPRVAAALLRHGASMDARDANRETPLYRAVNLGYMEVARLLLESGAEPDLPDRLGQTPLHRAALKRHLELIELLAQHGAALHARDKQGNTPLQIAVSRGTRFGPTADLLARLQGLDATNYRGGAGPA